MFRSFLVLAAVVSMGFAGIAAAALPPCNSDPNILDCFEPYKTELRSFHGPRLDAIADQIARSFRDDKAFNLVIVEGHAATFKATDPKDLLAINRAIAAASALMDRLDARGLPRSKYWVGFAFLGDSEPRSGVSNSTQAGRALNRRTEFRMTHVDIKDETVDGCRANDKLAADLKRHRATGSNAALKNCLAQKLAGEFACDQKAVNGPFVTGQFQFCIEHKGRSVAACLSDLDDTLVAFRRRQLADLQKLLLETPTSAVLASEDCENARKQVERSKVPGHVNSCYRADIEGSFKACLK